MEKETAPLNDSSKAITTKETIIKNEAIATKTKRVDRQIWLSVSEAAKFGGIDNKTVRRAIKDKRIKYKVSGNRYAIRLSSLVEFSHSTIKLKNKFFSHGLGQYVETFKKHFITK